MIHYKLFPKKILRYLLISVLSFCLIILNVSVLAENSPSLNYLAQGQEFYQQGNFESATEIWKKALLEYQKQGEIKNTAIALNYLAIVSQDLGKWQESQDYLDSALELISKINNSFIYAQILNTQGTLQAKIGQLKKAIASYQESETIYRSLSATQLVLRSQINQAQALQSLGFTERSCELLEQINQELIQLSDSPLKVIALQILGTTLRTMGELEKSQNTLNNSLSIAQKLNLTDNIPQIKLSLANTLKNQGKLDQAIAIYQHIQENNAPKITKIETAINLIQLLAQTKQKQPIQQLIITTKSDLFSLPLSDKKIEMEINLSHTLGENSIDSEQQKIIIDDAVEGAKKIKNVRLQSYSLGELGHFYEENKQWEKARQLTQQAIILAQRINASDIAIPWYWQTGRILTVENKNLEAIAAYEQAINYLQLLRQDIVAINPNMQFSFRDKVEPVYREYVQLLLKNINQLPDNIKQDHLIKSRDAIESLQLAELENFFREACLNYTPKSIEEIDSNAAVIYPIILENSLEIILSLPQQPLQHYQVEISLEKQQQIIQKFNLALNLTSLAQDILPPAQQLYNWLIKPWEKNLKQNKIETIVFVLDDWLRNLPMSVLHDGHKYLIETYNIVLNPGLQLVESIPTSQQNLQVLTGGLTEARQGFTSLPSVAQEVAAINNLLPSHSLLNQQFTRNNFQQQITDLPVSIVHLATHGRFSSQAENTFLLTWEDKLKVKEFNHFFVQNKNNPIQLLVLSACETAAGDKKATLGMAGFAIRSGARSTLASLWNVSDRSTTTLMTQFYQFLIQNHSTKAEALRQAQLSLLHNPQYQHPYYWSPFVLIGNWK